MSNIINEDTRMGDNAVAADFGMIAPLPKVREPEVFRGERSALAVESWIQSMDLYFELVKIKHSQDQLLYARSLLRGDAQLWYSQMQVYEAGQLPQDWEDLKVLLRREFIPINSVIQARDRLAALIQRGPVSEYINEFRRLKLQIPDLSQGDALDRFVRGLKQAIRIAVRSRFPATLSEAESLALAFEAAAKEEGSYAVPTTTQPTQPMVNYDPMELDSLRSMVNALTNQLRNRGNSRNRSYGTRGNNGFNRSNTFNGNTGGNGPRCYGCGGIGHMKRECPTYLNRSGRGSGTRDSNSPLKD